MGVSAHGGKNSYRQKLIHGISALMFVRRYAGTHIWLVGLYTVIGMSGALVGILGSLVSRDLVDIITGHKTGELITNFAMIIGMQLLTIAINNISTYLNTMITLKIGNEIKADVYDQIMTSEWEVLSQFHSGRIMARWVGDSNTVATGLLNTLPNFVIYLFRFGSAFYLVVKYDWTFAAIAIITVPVSFFVSRRNLRRMRDVNMQNVEFSTRMSGFTQESFSNVQNVKALDMVSSYCKQLRGLQKEQLSLSMLQQRVSILNSIILTIVSQAISYTIYGWGIYKVWSGAISYGTMTMFLSLSQSLSGTTQSLISLVPNSISMLNAVVRIKDIVELPKEDYSRREEAKEFVSLHAAKGIGVRLHEICFTYQNGNRVFHETNFSANPREVVGVVGPSGEGKTTMLRLLLSIIRMSEGTGQMVSVDRFGRESVMELSASTRLAFAYVPQGNSMFPGTIAQNMRMVRPNASDEEIQEALEMACAWEFVSELPEGIHSVLKERGGGLSEGQGQRLAIARALIRRSPILLLDEATSALDIETADRVLKNITNDSYPRTCILTTHRPEVMDICTKIYRISDERLYEYDR